jgi:enterochelin esterase family protein
MKSNYWIYVPAQYDPGQAAALLVWQDGQGLVERDGSTRAQIVFDSLTHRKKIPAMIHVFISPGLVGTRRMRSIEYDTVNDQHARFLRDDVLPEVYARYNIRKDGYSRDRRQPVGRHLRGFSPINSAACSHASAASPAFSRSPV